MVIFMTIWVVIIFGHGCASGHHVMVKFDPSGHHVMVKCHPSGHHVMVKCDPSGHHVMVKLTITFDHVMVKLGDQFVTVIHVLVKKAVPFCRYLLTSRSGLFTDDHGIRTVQSRYNHGSITVQSWYNRLSQCPLRYNGYIRAYVM